MTSKPGTSKPGQTSDPGRGSQEKSDWARKRKLDKVFGDDLPEQIVEPGENSGGGRGRDWYDQNRPPHYE
ncbi:hypothetical protein L5I01_16505 [Gordonia sp. HY442]|uniref:hypothetical protein n=1 Tax=Gordonia zhenghanii TaxID=2911516 RepID=UPI001F314F77|nr:hypothetical protein [Gordonia zhenghanii]MCF8604958.1 hypothetical protein [Gordonia zhenghanii]